MRSQLRKYLELERLMLILDEEQDVGADALRDAMDPIWYSLNQEERRMLDQRKIGRIKSLEGICVLGARALFGPVPAPPQYRMVPDGLITDWPRAA